MECKNKHFRVKKITNVGNLEEGDVLPTSDYVMFSNDDDVVQFEFVDPDSDNNKPTITKGIYKLGLDQYGSVVHKPLEITSDTLLKEYDFTASINKSVDRFFTKLDVYKKRNMFPKRAMLLHGPAGTGKSSSIIEAIKRYTKEDTAAIIWPTAALKSYHVHEFLSEVVYKDVKNLILVIEDIGGVEIELGHKMAADAELLGLLDNSLGTFQIPTKIIATTNFPGNLVEPLLRTGRFDEIFEVPAPNSDQRVKLLEFFAGEVDDSRLKLSEALVEIKKDKYKEFSVSDLKEIPLKAELDDMSMLDVLNALNKRKEAIKASFEKSRAKLGFDLDE